MIFDVVYSITIQKLTLVALQLASFFMGAKLCAECISLPLLMTLPAMFECTPAHLSRFLPSC
jgi:hypothetical protein